MSNFIQDKVVAGNIASTVWSDIVNKYRDKALHDLDENYTDEETGEFLEKRVLKRRFDAMVTREYQEALEVINTRDKKEGESDAEYDEWQGKMRDLVHKAATDIIKNYGPVIVRTVHDRLPIYDSDTGRVIPKTKMEEAYKAKARASAVNVDKTPQEQAQHAFNTFIAVCNKHGINPWDFFEGAVS